MPVILQCGDFPAAVKDLLQRLQDDAHEVVQACVVDGVPELGTQRRVRAPVGAVLLVFLLVVLLVLIAQLLLFLCRRVRTGRFGGALVASPM